MVNVEYSNHRPTISLAGELTDELALEVLDEIRRFDGLLLHRVPPGYRLAGWIRVCASPLHSGIR